MRLRSRPAFALLVCLVAAVTSRPAAAAASADESYLDGLKGRWVMDGTFLGKPVRYIAHWLDRFGAAGARVVGRGERHGDTLVIDFPYADGTFRDTLTWQPVSHSWSLLIESEDAKGAWSTFATYTLKHPPR